MSRNKRKRVRGHSEDDITSSNKRFKNLDEENKYSFTPNNDADSDDDSEGFPLRKNGRTLHLNLIRGDVANRILSVGDSSRAHKLSKFFDYPDQVRITHSDTVFKVFTGEFRGVPLSIVATGMGAAMIDFVVREVRHVVDGPIAMIRLGTCGVIHPDYDAGQLLVATKGSTFIKTHHDEIINGNIEKAYSFSPPVKSDIPLSSLLVCNLRNTVGDEKVKQVMNCSADSFYNSEGRIDPNFNDYNNTLISDLRKKFPGVVSLEMESFGLLSLATKDMHCTACAIGMIHQRVS